MSFEQAVLGFAVVATLLTILPGVDSALVLRGSIVHDHRYAWATSAGILTGVMFWGLAAAAGATAILAASEVAYRIVSLAGALYLFWMGLSFIVKSFRHRDDSPDEDAGARVADAALRNERSPWRGFRTGLTTNLLNPKVGVFYLAMIPQFMPAGVPPLVMGAVLALVHIALSIVWFGVLIFAGQAIGPRLSSARFLRWLDRVTGGALLAFGAKLLIDARA